MQLNSVQNFCGVTLDLVFSSIPGVVVVPALDTLLPKDRHHPALEISFDISVPAHPSCTKFVPDYKRCNIGDIFTQIQLHNQSLLLECEQSFSFFCNRLSLIMAQNTHMKRVITSNFSKWFSSDLKNLVIRKKLAHKKYKSTGCSLALDNFRSLRRQCKFRASECYQTYIEQVEDCIPSTLNLFGHMYQT